MHDWQSRCLAEDVPARDVDARLHVRVALQRRVHPAVQALEISGVLAEQVRPEHREARAHAFGIRRQVGGPERTHLAVAGEPGVGLDPHERAVEDRHRLAARPLVAALVQGQGDRNAAMRVIFMRAECH